MSNQSLNLTPLLDDLVDRFEEAWAHDVPAVEDYFLSESDDSFEECAVELLRIDIERRYGRSDGRTLDNYLEQFAWLRRSPHLADLAFEEFRLRKTGGEPIRRETYDRCYGIDTSAWPAEDQQDCDTNALRGWNDSTLNLLANESERLVSAVANFPAAGDQFGDFRIIELIGEGKYSRVYLAQQGKLADRHVVLKVSPELWSESEKLARLQHTNIVPVYSIHHLGHLQAICMPYLGRSTLVDVLRRPELNGHGRPKALGFHDEGTFDELGCCRWMAKIALGLEHAHRRGIVHRDLKPANVLVSTDDEPLILDFNLSEDIVVGGPASVMVGGTLPYMSPEHLRQPDG